MKTKFENLIFYKPCYFGKYHGTEIENCFSKIFLNNLYSLFQYLWEVEIVIYTFYAQSQLKKWMGLCELLIALTSLIFSLLAPFSVIFW